MTLNKNMENHMSSLKNRINLLENEDARNLSLIKIKRNLIKKIIDINHFKENNSHSVCQFIKDYKIKNEIIIRKRKYQFKNLVFQMHTIKISLRSQIIRFKTKINEQRRSL